MSLRAAAFCLAAGAAPATAMPSGEDTRLHDVLVDDVGAEIWLRFRFLMPAIAREDGRVSYMDVQEDFEYLCQEVALPYLADYELEADVIVVTLLDRPVDFGYADPAATQFIEAFSIASGDCAWMEN